MIKNGFGNRSDINSLLGLINKLENEIKSSNNEDFKKIKTRELEIKNDILQIMLMQENV